MQHSFLKMPSPVGELTLVADEHSLCSVLWKKEKPNRIKLPKLIYDPKNPVLKQAQLELTEYFAGKRQKFSVALNPSGTEFQQKVWMMLRKIPFGETWSYGELAKKMGAPKSSRAVGMANSKNPLSIIVPCHRVIGADGSLTGFAGGLNRKKLLLNLEQQR